ncbi:MAG: exodeoxyribonuclease VII small subunit [Helicobacteraceae bacterium]|jgi:exodeoxyribonuclease VII small subunit|nr:exodeoxyribonuclease VII small subunit [Helicobacteraceae bacterium]
MVEANQSYEAKIEAAKAILAELNKSDLPLDKATALFKEGKKLLDEAAKLLENAKLEYEELQNSNG